MCSAGEEPWRALGLALEIVDRFQEDEKRNVRRPAGRAGRRQAPVLGITGNIGTGKSTITKILAEQGVHVIDADRVVHDLYADSSSSLVKAVVAEFGRAIVAPDGTLDRTALGRIVFDDAVALGKLETIVHPAVVAEVQKSHLTALSQHTPCAIEAIKLIESDLVGLLDAVWIVVATPELQRARLCAKGMSAQRSATANRSAGVTGGKDRALKAKARRVCARVFD